MNSFGADHAVAAITGIDALQPVEAGQQQSGADEQHDANGHLRDDERVLQAASRGLACAGALPCFIAAARSTRDGGAGSVRTATR